MSRTSEEKLVALRKILDIIESKYGISSWCFIGRTSDGRLLSGCDADLSLSEAQDLFVDGTVELNSWTEVPGAGEIIERNNG